MSPTTPQRESVSSLIGWVWSVRAFLTEIAKENRARKPHRTANAEYLIQILDYDLLDKGLLDKGLLDKGLRLDMILHCPQCATQHIDAPDDADRISFTEASGLQVWNNPPHKSHLCHECGCIWRPANVCTNGVLAITTRGKNDTWPLLPALPILSPP